MRPRLLIVDDEPDMLDFLERVFRADYDVTRAAGGDEALACLAACPYDILVTDQKMPHMSGIELLDRIADIRLVKVLLSGFTNDPEVQRLVDTRRVDQYVVKPVDSQSLQEAVAHAFAAAKR